MSTSPHKLLVIDGHSMAFRAFYALPTESFLTDSGQYTNAVHGFTNMLLKLIREELPTHVILAFDLDTPTFRHTSYAEYKGGRAKTPEEFRGQIDLIKQVAEGMNIAVVTLEGYEADDIVATYATRADTAGWETLIVSGDRDTLQLVTERTTLMYPTSGLSKVAMLDPAAVEEKYLVPPLKYPDLAALVGESADNLPGVPKVGPKTAAKWIAEYGSTRGIIENADAIGGKAGENLREALADVERNLELNLLLRDLDLPVALEDSELQLPDREVLDPLFDALQFNQIRERLFETFSARFPEAVVAPEPTEALPAVTVTEQAEELAAFLKTHTGAPMAISLCLDRSGESLTTKPKRDEAARVAEALAVVLVPSAPGDVAAAAEGAEPPEADSAETDDAGDSAAEPAGIPALAVSLSALDAKADAVLAEWLQDPEAPKLVHDIKDAGKRLAWRGLHLRGAVEDTLISGYLIQPDRRNFAFAELVTQYLGASTDPASYLGGHSADDAETPGSQGPDLFSSQDLLPGVTAEDLDAAALHGMLLHQLSQALGEQLVERNGEKLLREMEIPLAEILLQMELTGIAVSTEKLDSLDAEFAEAIEASAQEAYAVVGHEVKLGSPKQLQAVLFEELELPTAGVKKNKTGYSTDVETLQALLIKTQNDFLVHLMNHRDSSRLRQTVTGLTETVTGDGRIHTTYAQTVAATGRLSSLNPNLQNIPVRTAEGRKIREAFVVGAGYESLLTADYSQIEMRIMAHLSQDQALIEAFRAGEDLHNFVGSRVFGVEASEITPEQRSKVKAMSYGLAYGLSSFGLSKQLGIGVDEARNLMNEYFERFGGVRDYLREVVTQAKKDGFTSTIFGRRRYLPDLTSENRQLRQMAERAALNAPIQGSAADIIKQAMIGVDSAMRAEGLESRLLLQVHDELIFEVAAGEREALENLVVTHMGAAAELDVPLDVHVGVGSSWHEAAH
ncbi:DNA polymerase-1 [Nesterenkonia halotolerans]|uniref:DNA polymerase I n=1 Tax=Nesterenkonia halotolerans TaxID=225325 RepID=A0ABR9J4P7_9MICC|nr:DNA polymerase I [Nesterenkonia halotolerans]MBE1513880.1 DNA polymerase-1 [Nesterenkonia halotolerans]